MADSVKVRWNASLFVSVVLAVIFGFVGFIRIILDVVRKGPFRELGSRSRNARPDVLANSAFGSHGFVRLRSIRLKLHFVASGPTNKPLMLFIHGFPEFWYSWRHQMKEFSKDYRTVAFDMRGYGDSDKPSGICEYTLDKLVEDLNQLITELGYEKCILVGHDWGGIVAWGFAALHPDRVEQLILGNSPHSLAFEKHLFSGAISQLLKSWYVFFWQVPVLPIWFLLADDLEFMKNALSASPQGAKPGTFTAEDMEAYKYTFATYGDLCGPVNFYRAAIRYQSPRVYAALRRKISVRTLLIWGTNDGFMEKKLAELSGRFVERCSVHYIEGASHWVQQEEPEQFNLLMRQFLNNEL